MPFKLLHCGLILLDRVQVRRQCMFLTPSLLKLVLIERADKFNVSVSHSSISISSAWCDKNVFLNFTFYVF